MNQVRTYIYKKKHKSGSASWIVRWKDLVTGIWKNMSAGKSKDEALYMEAEVRKALFQGQNPKPESPVYTPKMTVSELIDQLYQSHRYLSISTNWQHALRGKYENYIRPIFGEVHFSELKKERLYQFYMNLKTKGFSHTTIQKYHYTLTILGDLYCDLNPSVENNIRKIRDFNRFFPKQPPTRNIDFLTLEELEKLFVETKRSQSPLLYSLVKFLAYTGLRRTEALDLKWNDIDHNSGFIHIRKSKNGSSRVVPLEEGAVEALSILLKNNEYVFSRADGSRQRFDSFRLPLKRAQSVQE
ncbi:MAG: tyrosine-type recombinase/integrase [Deltaproteobacteria bacterium]|nr:tyrosine-type recombinase/integrase [Deltaproteobacteria bacterium]